jgi:hypothetical protein
VASCPGRGPARLTLPGSCAHVLLKIRNFCTRPSLDVGLADTTDAPNLSWKEEISSTNFHRVYIALGAIDRFAPFIELRTRHLTAAPPGRSQTALFSGIPDRKKLARRRPRLNRHHRAESLGARIHSLRQGNQLNCRYSELGRQRVHHGVGVFPR